MQTGVSYARVDTAGTERFVSLRQMLGGALPYGAAFVAGSLVRDDAWRGRRLGLVLATLVTWATMIAFVATMAVYLPAHGGRLGPEVPIGWPNRAMIAAFALWPAAAV